MHLAKQKMKKQKQCLHNKEIQTKSTLILPIYCGIQKETVYKTVPWLKNRAFEKIKHKLYNIGECETIVCRIINRLLDEINVIADISVLGQLLLHNSILPFYDMLNILYNNKYYLSTDLRLNCIELCNILSLLGIIYNILGVPIDSFKKSLFNLPTTLKDSP